MSSSWTNDHDRLRSGQKREPGLEEAIRILVRLTSVRRHPWIGVTMPFVLAFLIVSLIVGIPIVVSACLWGGR